MAHNHTSVLKTYFQYALVKAGFPDDFDVEYSLSYSQGDGVAFYGRMTKGEIIHLFTVLYPQKRKQKMFAKLIGHIWEWQAGWCDLTFEIKRNQFGYRYSHCNTMFLSAYKSDDLDFFNDPYARKAWYFSAGKVERYKKLWDEFIEDLEGHIKNTSRILEEEGYRIIEATPMSSDMVYRFNTKNYRIELLAHHSQFYDEEPCWLIGDSSDVDEMIHSILNGECRYADLEAQVTDRRNGIVLGTSYLSGVSYETGDKTFGGYRDDLIRFAIQHAREFAVQHSTLHA